MFNIKKYISKNTISFQVHPNTKREQPLTEHDHLHLSIHTQTQDNKSNLAVIKFFKKNYKLKVRIKLGEKSKDKVLAIM